MPVSLLLEVAISMVFLYLLGSQVVLSIYELWAGYTNSRGKFLYRQLKETLGTVTTQALYAQKPVAALTPAGQAAPTTATEGTWRWWWGKDGLPAYIPADLFASALLTLVAPTATGQPSLTAALAAPPAEVTPPAVGLLQSILAGLDAQASLGDCQKSVAAWYDAYCERLTGWYKRRVRLWLFLIGLFVAFVSNIDSPHILRYLWLHPQLSHRLADNASQRAAGPAPRSLSLAPPPASPPATSASRPARDSARIDQLVRAAVDTANAYKARLLRLGFPVGRTNDVPVDSTALPAYFYIYQPAQTVRVGRTTYSVAPHYLRYKRHRSTQFQLSGIQTDSLSWRTQRVALARITPDSLHDHDRTNLVSAPRPTLQEWFNPQPQPWGLTWLGWLLTAAALSVGAPFWFDLLCRLVNIRNLGIKPPRPEQ